MREQESPIDQLRYSKPGRDDKRKPLSDIAAGDRVWCGCSSYRRSDGIKTIHRTTSSQVMIRWNGDDNPYERKYWKNDGWKNDGNPLSLYVVGHSLMGDLISGIATPEECAAWDAAAAVERARLEAEQKVKDEREAIRLTLNQLFEGLPDCVRNAERGDDAQRAGKWAVHLDGLTDDQVREVAKAVKAILEAK